MKGYKIVATIILVLALAIGVMYYWFPGQLGDLMLQTLWKGAGLDEKSIQVNDHKITYLEGGEGKTVVLVHGFGGDKGNWIYFAWYLTGDYHVIIPDLPGFGDSTRLWTASYDFPDQVERLHSFITQLKLNQVNLVGNSMGGEICGLYAVKYPKEVKSLTLIDAAGVNSPKPSELSKLLAQGQNPLIAGSEEEYDRLMNFTFDKAPYIPGPIKKNMVAEAISHKPLNEKTFKVITKHIDMLEPQLGQIEAPVLVIWGNHDRALDLSSVFVYKEALKNQPNITIVKNSGHLPMTENPKETAQAFKIFIDSI
ncbi:MAG: alpha/beta fold hydrolase [Ignavibacteriales bacterium]